MGRPRRRRYHVARGLRRLTAVAIILWLDYSQVIGNALRAPYLNSLRRQGALLSQFYAEAHPSDANYLALAGGSVFGVPPTNPAESNPLYTISARNIGDLITARHETWKAYLHSGHKRGRPFGKIKEDATPERRAVICRAEEVGRERRIGRGVP
jgi:Phosphoesterase family